MTRTTRPKLVTRRLADIRTHRLLLDPRHVIDAANDVLDRLVLPDGRNAAHVIVAEAERRQESTPSR